MPLFSRTDLINHKTMIFDKTDILKHDLKQFLDDLKLDSHWLYTLMHNASKSSIIIIREGAERLDFEDMSVADFERRYDDFDPKEDAFALCMHLYDFNGKPKPTDDEEDDDEPTLEMLYVEDLKVENIIEEFPHILAHICRQAMSDGNPLIPDDATMAKYGFTDADAKRMGKHIDETNARLMKEFRAEYERLKRIVENGV